MKNRGLMLATAAAVLLTTNNAVADTMATHSVKPVKCYGVNSCRGRGQCGSKTVHACAGQNSCKGKSWLYLSSAEQCRKQGGTVIK